jgi:hypothetical protein
MLLLLTFYLVFDIGLHKAPMISVKSVIYYVTLPLLWLGSNPLFVFIAMDMLDILMLRWVQVVGYNGKQMYLWAHWYHSFAASWIKNPFLASSVFAFYHVLLWVIVTGYMYYKKIFVTL